MSARAPGMLRRETNGVVFYQFEHLLGVPGVVHAVTTRIGGVSQKPWDELNVGMHVGDRLGDVVKNRRLVSGVLGVEPGQWELLRREYTLVPYIVDREQRCDLAEEVVSSVHGAQLRGHERCLPVIAMDHVRPPP